MAAQKARTPGAFRCGNTAEAVRPWAVKELDVQWVRGAMVAA
jgi:hypothetical protein